MRTSNPVLNTKFFSGLADNQATTEQVMTIDGTVQKTGILLFITAAVATLTWGGMENMLQQGHMPPMNAVTMGTGLLGLAMCFVLSWKKQWAAFLAPLYAIIEGAFIGAFSLRADLIASMNGWGGIVFPAILLTFGIALSMLGLYAFRIIKVSQRMRSIVMTGMSAIFFVYLASFVLGFFGVQIPFIHSNGPIGILFSLAVCGFAAFSLLTDFQDIERGAEMKGPKYLEWYFGFGILVSLVWLYIEIIRLFMKLNSRD